MTEQKPKQRETRVSIQNDEYREFVKYLLTQPHSFIMGVRAYVLNMAGTGQVQANETEKDAIYRRIVALENALNVGLKQWSVSVDARLNTLQGNASQPVANGSSWQPVGQQGQQPQTPLASPYPALEYPPEGYADPDVAAWNSAHKEPAQAIDWTGQTVSASAALYDRLKPQGWGSVGITPPPPMAQHAPAQAPSVEVRGTQTGRFSTIEIEGETFAISKPLPIEFEYLKDTTISNDERAIYWKALNDKGYTDEQINELLSNG